MKLLEDKRAVVTGATSGIGKAIALLFLQHGATVIGIGTNPEKGQKVLEEVTTLGLSDQFSFIPCDVSDQKQIQHMFKQISTLDILVNNAGITRDGLLIRMSAQDWHNVIDTNLSSCFFTCQLACKKMMKAKQGRIINISSIVGLMGNAGQTNYAASKAGMIGFSQSLAKEMASRNILVNCIAPGFIQTEMTQTLLSEKLQAILDAVPLHRTGTSEEIAQAALFFASNMSSYITGQTLVVDGGLYMG